MLQITQQSGAGSGACRHGRLSVKQCGYAKRQRTPHRSLLVISLSQNLRSPAFLSQGPLRYELCLYTSLKHWNCSWAHRSSWNTYCTSLRLTCCQALQAQECALRVPGGFEGPAAVQVLQADVQHTSPQQELRGVLLSLSLCPARLCARAGAPTRASATRRRHCQQAAAADAAHSPCCPWLLTLAWWQARCLSFL